jgi:hypothetical protein
MSWARWSLAGAWAGVWMMGAGVAFAQAPPDLASGSKAPAVAPEPTVEPRPAPAASDVAVSARVSPDPSRIGDVLTYEVTAVYPAGLTINLPIGVELAGVEIVGVEESPAVPTGDGFRKVFTFALQRFEIGDASVPPFELTAVTPDGEVSTIQVPASKFVVDSLTINEPSPERRGEERPLSPDFPNEAIEWIVYGLLVGVLLAALIWWLFRRFFARGPAPVIVPAIPPDQVAIEALNSLEERRVPMLERGESATYYLDLTDITKAYIEGRFEIAAMDRTTDELREVLVKGDANLGPLSATDVLAFLDRSDLIKFARVSPSSDEAREDLESVRELVAKAETALRAARAAATADAKAHETVQSAGEEST